MRNNIISRIYSIVNTKYISNRKKHFTYGWADNPLSVLKHFYEQRSLPSGKRVIENGEYVVLFHDKDSGEFGYAGWEWNINPEYDQRVHTMA